MRKRNSPLRELANPSFSSCIGKGPDGSTLRSRFEAGRAERCIPHADLETLDATTPTVRLRRRKYASHI